MIQCPGTYQMVIMLMMIYCALRALSTVAARSSNAGGWAWATQTADFYRRRDDDGAVAGQQFVQIIAVGGGGDYENDNCDCRVVVGRVVHLFLRCRFVTNSSAAQLICLHHRQLVHSSTNRDPIHTESELHSNPSAHSTPLTQLSSLCPFQERVDESRRARTQVSRSLHGLRVAEELPLGHRSPYRPA